MYTEDQIESAEKLGLARAIELMEAGNRREANIADALADLSSLPKIDIQTGPITKGWIDRRSDRRAKDTAEYFASVRQTEHAIKCLIMDEFVPLGGGLHPTQINVNDKKFYNIGMVLGDRDGIAKYKVENTKGGKLQLAVWNGNDWGDYTERTFEQADREFKPAEILDCWQQVKVRTPEGEEGEGYLGYAWAAFFSDEDGAIVYPNKRFTTDDGPMYSGFWNRSKAHPGHGRRSYKMEKSGSQKGRLPVRDGAIGFFSDKEEAVRWLLEQDATLAVGWNEAEQEYTLINPVGVNLELRHVLYAKGNKRSATTIYFDPDPDKRGVYFIDDWSRTFENAQQYKRSHAGSFDRGASRQDVADAIADDSKFLRYAPPKQGEKKTPNKHLTITVNGKEVKAPPVPDVAPAGAFEKTPPLVRNFGSDGGHSAEHFAGLNPRRVKRIIRPGGMPSKKVR